MKDEDLELLITKYLSNTITKEEEALFLKLINDSQARRQYEEALAVWNLTSKLKTSFDPDLKLQAAIFNSRINTSPSEAPLKLSKPIKMAPRKVRYWVKIAAAIIILVASSFVILTITNKVTETNLITVETKSEFSLPDGSKVWLNENSRLTYPTEFGNVARQVDLAGEAYFEVKSNADLLFIITNGNTQTKVLGTSFSVKDNIAMGVIEVAVVSGKVSLSGKRQTNEQILFPGYKGVYNKKDNSIINIENDDPNFLAWKTGEIEFHNSTFADVVKTLENYFHRSVIIENQNIVNCIFTGSFNKPELESFLKTISISMDIEYRYDGNTIVISGEGCQ